MRKLLIFGNGLGRSLDSEFFDLSAALHSAWQDPNVLTEADKGLIRQCLPADLIENDEDTPPQSESDLGTLQRVLAACDEIVKHQRVDEEGWLTEHGMRFPSAIRSFVHRAAAHFHSGEFVLPDSFSKPLLDFARSTHSHVATLNYDELLYRAFIGSDLFDGYNRMIDGFVPYFNSEKLDRWYPGTQSYYLHLHGSPLYYQDIGGNLRKSPLSHLPSLTGYSSTHLVLTHTDFKPTIINSSKILREYWNRLREAASEVEAIVLVGYSGADPHLNELIASHATEKQLEIVERLRPEYEVQPTRQQRFDFWRARLGVSPWIFWHQSVLDQSDWDYAAPAQTPEA